MLGELALQARSQASQRDADPGDFSKGAWVTMLQTLDLPPFGV